jgi:EAL domain-containing protein (putative c-di-GMP-specific phosphodiesterase class I)
VSLSDGHIIGLEALLRWQHPEQGLLLPSAFLDLAEEAGFLNEIEEWLLLEACHQLVSWQKLSLTHEPLALSINLSMRQFEQPNLVERIAFILSETGITPHSLCLEFTEAVFDSQNGINQTLSRLHDLGVQVHMDNFGIGCSSLSKLHHASINALKIDRSLVKRLNGDEQGENAIVRTIMAMARELKMSAIAEGVETDHQAAYLKSLNCQFAQGYFFSKPLPAKDVDILLNANS